jgi:hypothetical protein
MNDSLKAACPNRKDFPDVGLLRPYFDDMDLPCVTGKRHGLVCKLPFDPNTTVVKQCVLRKEEWMEVDQTAQRAARYRMQFVGKLLYHKLFDDEPGWRDDVDHPMPFTHADAWLLSKLLCESRNLNEPLSFTMIEVASRRIAECLEQSALGVDAVDLWQRCHPNDPNLPQQLLDLPKTVGMFNHPAVVKVKCPQLSQDNIHRVAKLMLLKAVTNGLTGPFMFVHGLELDQHLDNDFRSGNGHEPPIFTNRETIKDIVAVGSKHVKVLDVMRSDLFQDEFGLIQMTKDVVKVRIGQQPTVVQWGDDEGGLRLNFKALAVVQTEFSGKGIVLAD